MRPSIGTRVTLLVVLVVCSFFSLSIAFAPSVERELEANNNTVRPQSGLPAGPGGHPPPEAAAACISKTSGEKCSMSMPDGNTLSGVCRSLDGETGLSCIPSGAAPLG